LLRGFAPPSDCHHEKQKLSDEASPP
jgi:hypothetical protein